jgi:O-antigen/teichoic acid export membrane protein
MFSMLAGVAFGPSLARRDPKAPRIDRAVLKVATAWSLLIMCLCLAGANQWALFWESPDSVTVTRLIALSIPFSAASSVLAGVLRREARVQLIAVRLFISQALGMAIGATTVYFTQQPWSLAVSVLTASVVGCALLARLAKPRSWPTQKAGQEVRPILLYAVKMTSMNLLRYGSALIPAWVLARSGGMVVLGNWNRATTLVTVPLQTVSTSVQYSLFADLRPLGPLVGTKRLSDLLILITWPSLILTAVVPFIAPWIVRLVLGSEWDYASDLSVWAALLGLISLISVPLGAVMEAGGYFRATLLNWILSTTILVAGATYSLAEGRFTGVLIGAIIAAATPLVLYPTVLWHWGRISLRRIVNSLWRVALLQAAVVAFLVTIATITSSQASVAVVAVGLGGLEAAILWSLGSRTTFGRIAQGYGLPVVRRTGSATERTAM